jgi:hypothetical protein
MSEFRASTKPCPVCGVALTRIPTDGSSIVYRCHRCKIEVVKPIRRDLDRPPATRRKGIARFRS